MNLELSNSKELFIIDDEDLQMLLKHNTKFYLDGYGNVTTWSKILKANITISKLILNISHSGSKDIDHINRNNLDNRKSNLRFISHADNCVNRRKRIKTKSKYRGVCWDKISNCWRPIIGRANNTRRGKRTHDEILAATIADDFMLELYGSLALPNLNFPLYGA